MKKKYYQLPLLIVSILILSAISGCDEEDTVTNTTGTTPTPTVVTNPFPAVQPFDLATEMKKVSDNMLSRWGIPGIVISVRKGSAAPVTVASTYPGFPTVSTSSAFKVGSITKLFTATLCVRLQKEGRLNLDVVRFPPNTGPTLRMYLNHTAGAGNYLASPAVSTQGIYGNQYALIFTQPLRVWYFNELVSLSVPRPIGVFEYSNTGYFIAGRQAEIFADTGFNPFGTPELQYLFDKYFFKPQGMTSTKYQETLSVPSNLINGYDLFPDGKIHDVTQVHPSVTNAAGALITNASDLHTFIHNLFNGRIVSANSLAQMKSTVPESTNVGYGLGFHITSSSLGIVYTHDGAIPGYLTSWHYYPSLDASIIVFVNTYTNPSASNSQTESVALVEPMLLR